MTLATEVTALTLAATELLEAVNVSKATLDGSVSTATTSAVEAAASAALAAAKAVIAEAAANNAAIAVASQLNSIKSQTEQARDQAIAGLGAADNSQILSELLGQVIYAADMATQAIRDAAGVPIGVDRIAAFSGVPMDFIGAISRTLLFCIKTVGVPATATSYGQKGDFAVDSNYIFVCTATNTWKRVAITTW